MEATSRSQCKTTCFSIATISVVHYRTPTEPGSSGSPVFNSVWKVIAIHHAGGEAMPRLNGQPGTYAANEGIRIDFLRKTIDSQAAGAT